MATSSSIHFEISERKILLRLFDVFIVLVFLFTLGNFFQFDYFTITINNFYWTIVLAIYLTIIGSVFEMYNLQVASDRFQITKSIILTSSVTTLLYLLTPFYTPILPNNRLQILLFYFSMMGALLLWRNFYIVFLASNRFIKKVVFIGSSKKIDEFAKELKSGNPHYQVRGFVATDEKNHETEIPQIATEDLKRVVESENIAEIVVTYDANKVKSTKLYDELLLLLESGVVIRQYSELYESETYRLPIHFDDKELYKFFPFSRSNHNKFYMVYNRFLDVILSIIGLLVFSALIPIVFILNFLGNKGPLFYKQERVGKNGKPFQIIKLRTMVVDAEKEGAVFAKTNDNRITPLGKFLRKTRLDEVPQFINVLKGDMAVIGPRPERPIFVEQIAQSIPLYQTRHVIKPGLTGWAQVNYPYGQNLEDSLMKLRYDLYYIKHRSLYLDINITVKTLSTVLFFRGQ